MTRLIIFFIQIFALLFLVTYIANNSFKVVFEIDFETLEYKNVNKKRYESIRVAKENIKFEDRIKVLAYFDDKISSFFWSIISKTLLYTSSCANSISDDIVSIDRAMRWGFGWNNEGDQGSNDVSGGIAVDRANSSAGDHIWCCQNTTGVNRTIRAEIWVR